MTAIVTNDIKRQLLNTVTTDVADSANYYYIGIAKSDQWNATDAAPTVLNSEKEKRDFRANLQSVIRTTDVSFVAARYNWSSGTIYNAYTDTNVTNTNYYVLTANNRIYLCVQQGKSNDGIAQTSTIDPETIGTPTVAKATSDGYIWKYLLTLTANNANKFLSANFVPVSKVDSAAGLGTILQTQLDVQQAADSGQIIGFRVTKAGSGYTSAPTVTINGDGVSAKAIATISAAGGISKVELDDSAGGIPFGRGYTYASISLSAGSAEVSPIISVLGLGNDPREDLNATSLMFNAKPNGLQGGAFIVKNDFRQIGLVKNPKKNQTVDSDFKDTAALALRKLTLSSISNFDSDNARDALIVGGTSGAKAFVDDNRASVFHYHQNDSTGFKPFQAGETISDANNASRTATIDADSDGTIKLIDNQILYIENRAPVVRDTAQTEDIKLIVQL
jgi:hypothetical protein